MTCKWSCLFWSWPLALLLVTHTTLLMYIVLLPKFHFTVYFLCFVFFVNMSWKMCALLGIFVLIQSPWKDNIVCYCTVNVWLGCGSYVKQCKQNFLVNKLIVINSQPCGLYFFGTFFPVTHSHSQQKKTVNINLDYNIKLYTNDIHLVNIICQLKRNL